MNSFRVTCITKVHPGNTHEHITHIGNSADGWKITREDAIRKSDSNTESFYVKDSLTGKVSIVGVVRTAERAPYLRTYADGYYNDNLLSLPQCS